MKPALLLSGAYRHPLQKNIAHIPEKTEKNERRRNERKKKISQFILPFLF